MLRGYIDAVGPYAVDGWVVDEEAADGRARVEVLAGGEVIGAGWANLVRDDLDGQPVGFHIELSRPVLLDLDMLGLTFRVNGLSWDGSLAGDPRPVALPFRLGSLYAYDGGWVQEVERLDETWTGPDPEVEARPAEDVLIRRSSDRGVVRHQINAVEGGRVRVTLAVAGRAITEPLDCGAATAKPGDVVGRVDTAGPQFITGWMRPGPGPSGRRYDVRFDGEFAGSGVAQRARDDVTSSLGIETPGLLFPIAKRWKDGRRHTVEIVRQVDGAVLGGATTSFSIGENVLRAQWRDGGLLVSLDCAPAALSGHDVEVVVMAEGRPVLTRNVHLSLGAEGRAQGAVLLEAEHLTHHLGRPLSISCPVLALSTDVSAGPEGIAVGNLRGNLDLTDGFQADGWCVYSGQTDRVVMLDAWLGDVFLGEVTAGHNRPDLRQLDLANTYHGFQVKFPVATLDGGQRQLVLRDRLLGADVPGSPRLITLGRDVLRTRARPPTRLMTQITTAPPVNAGSSAVATEAEVTVVILTRDGAEVLSQCLESLWWFTPRGRIRVVVVDHGSVDDTAEVVARWSAHLDIRSLAIDGNNSFSFGNNATIRAHADTPYVMLLNNDVVLAGDVIGAMVDALADPTVGLVGCKLLESRDPADVDSARVHHAGIQLTPFLDGIVRGSEAAGEMRVADQNRTIEPFSVTGACAMMRTADYLALGGLGEQYFYGGEDTDLGESVRARLGKRVLCLNRVTALHYRGWYRLSARGNAVIDRVWNNDRVLLRRVGHQMKKRYQRAMYTPGLDWSLHKAVVGFVVLEAGPMARTGESFTARELAAALERDQGMQTVFVDPDGDWYDASGLTCLVNTLHEYGIEELRNARPDLLRVAWLRNNFELWLDHPLEAYDLLLCSSRTFCEALDRRGFKAHHLPIATDPDRFATGARDTTLEARVVFNGSHSGVARAFAAEPGALPQGLAVWGHGWDAEPAVAALWRGFLPYDRMPDLYASVEVVVDDAQASARKWGGTNSRVFDAIAGGALPITNSQASSSADFDGLLPTWSTPRELTEQAAFWTQNAAARGERVGALQTIVRDRHAWSHRAAAFRSALETRFGIGRVAIKVGAPDRTTAAAWGDWHLAQALAQRLRRRGVRAIVQTLDAWREADQQVDAAIVLRGLSRYEPRPEDLNLLWLISHPDAVSLDELQSFDRIAFGSQALADRYGDLDGRSLVARQFSAFSPAGCDPSDDEGRLLQRLAPSDALVVGNTRGVRREFILGVHACTPLKFIGAGWDQYVSADHILADHVSNAALSAFYQRALVVVNDHWPDMAQAGIISNRIADVFASGGLVLSDPNAEGARLIGEGVFHASPAAVAATIDRLRREPSLRADLIAAHARRTGALMSADATADAILTALQASHGRRFAGWTPRD